MSTIDIDGFLSKDIDIWTKENLKPYLHIFGLAYEVNRFSQILLFRMKVHSENVLELLFSILFVRALSSFQGTIILFEKGMIHEAKVVLRNLLEILFTFMASINDNDFALQLILNTDKDKIKSIRKINDLKKYLKNNKQVPDFNEKLKVLMSSTADLSKTNYTTECISKKAGMHDIYLSAYHILSQTVHAKIGDLDKHIRKDGEEIFWGPSDDGMN